MKKILIIDDSFFQRKILGDIVTDCGCEATAAASGAEGLEKLKMQSFDCILMDLLMPGLSGIDMLEKFRDEEMKTAVIIVSADIQETVKEQCMELGAFAFINKPPGKEQLKELIRQSFSRKK